MLFQILPACLPACLEKMNPSLEFVCFVLAFVEGKSIVHKYLKMLEDEKSRTYKYIKQWESEAKHSEEWIVNIANLVVKLRANKRCRLDNSPNEYGQAVSKFQEYHSNVNGEELVFPSLGDATRDDIHEIMERAIRRDKCVIHYRSKIAAITPVINNWKKMLHLLKLTPKNVRRVKHLKKGLEPQSRVKDLVVFSMFYNRQKRVLINDLLFTEELTKEYLSKSKIVRPNYGRLYFKLCMNRLCSVDSPLNLPIEMDNMICSFM